MELCCNVFSTSCASADAAGCAPPPTIIEIACSLITAIVTWASDLSCVWYDVAESLCRWSSAGSPPLAPLSFSNSVCRHKDFYGFIYFQVWASWCSGACCNFLLFVNVATVIEVPRLISLTVCCALRAVSRLVLTAGPFLSLHQQQHHTCHNLCCASNPKLAIHSLCLCRISHNFAPTCFLKVLLGICSFSSSLFSLFLSYGVKKGGIELYYCHWLLIINCGVFLWYTLNWIFSSSIVELHT